MEGSWRGLAVASALATWFALAAGGCGGGERSGPAVAAIETSDPARTFAPLVQLRPDERWMPMGARWFLQRSSLWFAEDQGCADRKIAVGRKLAAQRTVVVDWLFLTGLGTGPAYRRAPYDADCENDPYTDLYANQLTRPNHLPGRSRDLRLGEGYYLDLMDRARPGPGRGALDGVPAYVERTREQVGGEPGLRLRYWLLFGMDGGGTGGGAGARREGDWERVDVLLRGEDGAYEPLALEVEGGDGEPRRTPWRAVRRAGGEGGGGATTHPVVTAALGSHTLRPERTDAAAGARVACAGCTPWRTWRRLADVRAQPWYGFGGAWGEVGRSDATTGPLGPHGDWPPVAVDDDDPSLGLDAVVTRRPQEALAPLVHHHPDEPALPISVDRFLERATLKWRDGNCPGLVDVATGRIADRKTGGDVPRLDPRRMGGDPPYRQRAAGRDCEDGGGAVYSTTDGTHPFARRGRAAGLALGSGFYLDLLSDSYDGDPRVERRGGRRLVADATAYHDRAVAGGDDRPAVRFSYWMLYPHTELTDADGERLASHEGDWRRLDVIAIRGRRANQWLPRSVRYLGRDKMQAVQWRDAPRSRDDLTRGDGPGATHPIAYSTHAGHALHPRPGAHRSRLELGDGRTVTVVDRAVRCERCVSWPTWERLEPLAAQPWRDFGGGWGAAFRDLTNSGPPGPR